MAGRGEGVRFLRSFDRLGVVPLQDAVALRLVLVEDHEALREGLELLLGREGCEVVGTAGSLAEGAELIARTRPDVAARRHPPGRRERDRAHAPAARRQPRPARRPLHRGRATSNCCSTAWTPARGAMRSRRARRASWSARSDRRRGRHLRRPAPAPGAAVAPRHAAPARALQARARDHGPAGPGADRRAGRRAARALRRDRQDAHPQRDDQARGSTRVHAVAIALREGYISPPEAE